MGIPEMEEFWNSLSNKIKNKSATKTEEKQYKQIGKALYLLSISPRYPSLKTHEIEPLTNRIGMKVWQSSLENPFSWKNILGIWPKQRRYNYTCNKTSS